MSRRFVIETVLLALSLRRLFCDTSKEGSVKKERSRKFKRMKKKTVELNSSIQRKIGLKGWCDIYL